MWTITIRRSSDESHEKFRFSEGKFESLESLIKFSENSPLFICRIASDNSVEFAETTATLQLILFDGKIFLFNSIAQRAYNNLLNACSIIQLGKENAKSNYANSLLSSSMVFLSALVEGFIIEFIKSIVNIRCSRIYSVKVRDYIFDQANKSIKRFNNPKKQNIKELLKQLNLYPEITEQIDFSSINSLVEYRNQIAHGAVNTPNINLEQTQAFYESAKLFMMNFSELFNKVVSNNEDFYEADSFFNYHRNTKHFTMWNFIPLVIKEVEIKTGYNNV